MPLPAPQASVQAGEAIQAGPYKIIPFHWTLRFGPPGAPFRFGWNRPTSILVISPDGQEQVLPVPDITRQIQIGLLAAGLAGSVVIRLIKRRKK